MTINADYEKIEYLGNSFLTKKEELSNLITDLMEIINEDLHKGWGKEAYEEFKEKSITYIENFANVLNDINYIGEYLKKSSRVYSSIDEDFGNDMKKVGVQNEKR